MGNALADWINPDHLTAAAQEQAAARYRADPCDSLWIDDFLLPHRLDALRGLYRQDGLFTPWFGLYGQVHGSGERNLLFVDQAAYDAAPPEQRFEQETVLRGPKPGREMAPGFLTHLKFQHFCRQPPFRAFLTRLTGIDPGGDALSQVRITEHGHYVGRHRDSGGGRRLCLVFYPGEGWEPSQGGHLIQYLPQGGSRRVEPRPNRLLVFHVSDRSFHAVEPVVRVPRWGYTVWLGNMTGEDAGT